MPRTYVLFSDALFVKVAKMSSFSTREAMTCHMENVFCFSAFIVFDKTSDRPKSKGFGFVTFVDQASADDCLGALDGTVSIYLIL